MSKELKLSLLALVALPSLAVWFFWGRPAADATRPSSLPEMAADAAPGPFAAPTTNLVAPLAGESGTAPGTPPPISSADGDVEARARAFMRHRPSFLKGAPLGCDPPYTIDAEGNKHYKKECF